MKLSHSVKTDPAPATLLHFIPQDGIGGAEIAARSATIDPAGGVHLHALFNGLYRGAGSIANPRLTGADTRSPWTPASIVGALAQTRSVQPDVLVFSLWRSFGAFLVLRIRYPRRRFVTFLHNERVANIVDGLLNTIMMRLSHAIWVDSRATLEARLRSPKLRARARIISLILYRPSAAPRAAAAAHFVYWGRLTQQKRIDRAIGLFATIAHRHDAARLTVIGPDHGVRTDLERQAANLGLSDRIAFEGPAGRDRIERAAADASFFLQLSDHEGMAMGVVEALQLGLVPVVTPVGQMASYCRDGVNALIYRDDQETAARIEALLADPAAFGRASTAAIATFADAPTYSEDVATAARAIAAL